jgi:SAM-dependent methyltransferase
MSNIHLTHRENGYCLLSGNGLEIGAFNEPATLPASCSVKYFDAISKEEATKLFPEINPDILVNVDYIGNLDTPGLVDFPDNNFDFVIMNHVIEHLANPIKTIGDLFRILKHGGKVVISAPDKDYTFDKNRKLTSISHLFEEYNNNVTEVSDEHYIDFIKAVHPELMQLSQEDIDIHIQSVKKRKEHAHVWDSESFSEFLKCSLLILKIDAINIYSSFGKENNIECFSVWKKI